MRGTSPILVSAALSIAGLIAVAGLQVGERFQPNTIANTGALEPIEPRDYIAVKDDNGNGIPDWQDELRTLGVAVATSTDATTTDPVETMADSVAGALYGGYLSLKQSGSYSRAEGEDLAFNVAANIRAPLLAEPLTVDDVKTRDNSSAAALSYRAEMRTALAPMMTEDPPELEFYAQYIQTKDSSWLTKLSDAAARYRAARDNMLAVPAPKAAVPEHLRALNALSAYAETLERLARFAPDTFAALALLKTMNETEEEMLSSFDALAQYYVRTIAQN